MLFAKVDFLLLKDVISLTLKLDQLQVWHHASDF